MMTSRDACGKKASMLCTPKVSICIPTFNRAHVIGRSLDMLLQQTFKDFELIVIDDGSTDKLTNIVLQNDVHRIWYIKDPVN